MSLRDALKPGLIEYATGGGGGGGLTDFDFNVDYSKSVGNVDDDQTATKGNRFLASKDLKLWSVCFAVAGVSAVGMKVHIYVHGGGTDVITAKYTSNNQETLPGGTSSIICAEFFFDPFVEIAAGTLFDVVGIPVSGVGAQYFRCYAVTSAPGAGSFASGAMAWQGKIEKAVVELSVGNSIEVASTTSHFLQTINSITAVP